MVFDKVREIIAEQLDVDTEEITLDTNLIKDLEADSLDAVEIIMALEDEYNIEIPTEELQEMTTVGAVLDYLKRAGIDV